MFVDTISRPVPTGHHALVKVKAFGLNRMDLLQREGRYPLPPGVTSTMGVEFSGVIEEIADAQSNFKVGDEVFGLAYGGILSQFLPRGFRGKKSLTKKMAGAYAEYISVSTRMIIPKPSELSWEIAAGIPEVRSTRSPLIKQDCLIKISFSRLGLPLHKH